MNKKILVVAAHADDEVLGCGGTIAGHRKRQDEVHILFFTDGVTSRGYVPFQKSTRAQELKKNRSAILHREEESFLAAEVLGVKRQFVHHLNLEDQRLDRYAFLDLVKCVEALKAETQPQCVYTHFWNDLNMDHRLVSQAVVTSFRPRGNDAVIPIFCFEVPESTYLSIPDGKKAFNPNYFLDISSTLPVKLKALAAYESERRVYPDMRSAEFIQELAEHRGKENKTKYAEAFVKMGSYS